jgi:excisionase family DNA binding protein
MDDYITVPEAAALLGYHRSSVDALITREELPARRINARLYLVKRSDVEALPRRGRGRPRKIATDS